MGAVKVIGDFPMVRCEGCRSLIAQTERAMRKHYGECAGAMRLRLDQLERKARRTDDETREIASLKATLEARIERANAKPARYDGIPRT